VSELWEVSGMIRSCMGVEDCELLEGVGVFWSCAGFVVEGSECQEMWE
jgi:hypothetical protein